jgi:hypothetical protein
VIDLATSRWRQPAIDDGYALEIPSLERSSIGGTRAAPWRRMPIQPHLAFLAIVAIATLATSAHAQQMETVDGFGEPTSAAVVPGPRLAISTDPIGLLSGRYALSGTYVAWRHVGVRADITIDEDMPMLPGSGSWRASVNVPIYLDRALSGPFVEPGLALANRFMGYDAVGLGGIGADGSVGLVGYGYYAQHAHSIEPQIFVGWSLLYRSRLQIAGAIGASRHFSTDGSGVSYPVPESYLRIGLAF